MTDSEENGGIRGFDSFELKLGDELRGERATLGKSLLDVQRDLRIKAAYIAAIENCDIGVFPNQGFIAGYVRSYARYLKLDPDTVFRRFCVESGFGGVNAGLQSPKKSSSGRIVSSGPVRATKDDPILRPVRPAADLSPGFFESFSLSAIGSLAVLVSLIAGLAYGGYAVLQDIQRVEITPVDQRPNPLSEMSGLRLPGLDVQEVALVTDAEGAQADADLDLARLYQPRELEVPVIDSRDGPIVDIDPEQTGILARRDVPLVSASMEREMDAIQAGMLEAASASADPVVREAIGPPKVNVTAKQPAWVRVYLADGTVLFEKILETGETYTLPTDVEAPLLRAGNAGSVYLLVNQEAFGPVGTGTGVAKNVSLLPADIETAFAAVTDLPEALQATVSALNVAPAE